MVEEIQELFEYNRWANHRLLDATAALNAEEFTRDLKSSFPSVRDTLAHILSSEWVWLTRWKGESPSGPPASWNFSTHGKLRALWAEIETELAEFVGSLTPASLGEVIAYRNTRDDPFAQPLWELLRHVVNHSTYHRGQVTTMLRQLGKDSVATDLVVFYRQRSVIVPVGSVSARVEHTRELGK